MKCICLQISNVQCSIIPQINYLRVKKPKPVGIVNVFHTLFSDESMYSYNYSGICNHGSGRKAMQNYTIFTVCMLG